MVGSEINIETWSRFTETEKLRFLQTSNDVPVPIFVAASQDPSLVVRTHLVICLENMVKVDYSWIKLLKMLADKDPEPVIRKMARNVLRQTFTE